MSSAGAENCTDCGSPDAYASKNVPRKRLLGLLVVSLAAILYVLSVDWMLGMGFLLALTAVDFILYRLLPDVSVCYGCGKITPGKGGWAPYDPHIGERYRRSRLG